jgi:hypothetical protein
MDIRVVTLESGEYWFKPFLNIHTTLHHTLAPIFFYLLLQLSSPPPQKKKLFRYKKYMGPIAAAPPPSPSPEVTIMLTGNFEVQTTLLYMFLDG